MATEMKIWRVSDNKKLEAVPDAGFELSHLEEDLESWIAASPDILGEELLVVARQYNTPVGRLDLLCVDSDGVPVIVELKRDSTPREAVAQALDYASWLDSLSVEEFKELAAQYLGKPLNEALSEVFLEEAIDLSAIDCQKHRIILVAPKLDAAAERIITYLAGRHRIAINAVFFKYAKVGSEEILVRSVLVAEDVRKETSGRSDRGPRLQPQNLLDLAQARQVTALVEICRQAKTIWDEVVTRTHGGSWLYSLYTDHGWRSFFGINVSGKLMGTPVGELDVWIRTKNLAEATSIDESVIREAFTPITIKSGNCIIRLRSSSEAEKLVQQLKQWTSSVSAQSNAASA